jgi:hypothetical protein
MKRIFLILIFLFVVCLYTQAQTVYSSAKGEKYHTGDCRLSGDADALTVDQAKNAGKKPCEVCKPNELGKANLKQCVGKTKNGARCKRMTTSTAKKCYQHISAKK